MPYLKLKLKSRKCPTGDCVRFAKLCVRRQDGDYYEAADRLADHMKLSPEMRRRVRQLVSYYTRRKKGE
jgi:hypothetical protein